MPIKKSASWVNHKLDEKQCVETEKEEERKREKSVLTMASWTKYLEDNPDLA